LKTTEASASAQDRRLQKLYVRSIVIDIQQKGSVGFLYVKPSDIVRTSPATIIIGRIYLNNLDHFHPVRIKLKIKAKVVEVPARKWRYNLQYYCKYPHLKTPKQRSNLKSRLLQSGDDHNLRTCKLLLPFIDYGFKLITPNILEN
jgi:hypothetical protein